MHRASVIVLLLAGCSSQETGGSAGSTGSTRTHTTHAAGSARPTPPPPRDRLAAVTTEGSTRITDVAFLPLGTLEGPIEGQYAVSWMGGASARADITCRMHGLNLVWLATPGSDHSQAFYPDPFDGGVPEACEVRWFVTSRDDEDEGRRETVVARACYRGGELTDGPCPEGSFPAPTLPAGMSIELKSTPTPRRFPRPMPPLQINQGTVQLNALATVGTKLARRPHVTLTCQQGPRVGSSTEPLVTIDLHRLQPGETVYSWSFLFHGDRELEAMTALDRCQLTMFARDPSTAKRRSDPLGTFCIQGTGETTPGPCVPRLGR